MPVCYSFLSILLIPFCKETFASASLALPLTDPLCGWFSPCQHSWQQVVAVVTLTLSGQTSNFSKNYHSFNTGADTTCQRFFGSPSIVKWCSWSEISGSASTSSPWPANTLQSYCWLKQESFSQSHLPWMDHKEIMWSIQEITVHGLVSQTASTEYGEVVWSRSFTRMLPTPPDSILKKG